LGGDEEAASRFADRVRMRLIGVARPSWAVWGPELVLPGMARGELEGDWIANAGCGGSDVGSVGDGPECAVSRWAQAVGEAVDEAADAEPPVLLDRLEDLTRRVEDLECRLGPPERRGIDRRRERRERRAPRERMVEVLLEKRKKSKGKEK